MLWIATLFASLPLDAFLRASPSTEPAPTPLVAVDARHVLAANAAAQARGIRVGMPLAAAYALAPDLQAQRRDREREAEALRAAATWAAQFTPNVAIERGAEHASRPVPHAGLVLEVSGSLKLFGGLGPILDGLRDGLQALGLAPTVASAPSARGAWWLAVANRAVHLDEQATLDAALARLPVRVLDCDAKTLDMFAAIGAERLGDLFALPRAGLARRFGAALLDQLDEARGRRGEAREFFVLPERFFAKLELPAHVEDAGALVFAYRRLLVALEGFLRARAAGVQRLALALHHHDREATPVEVGLVAPAYAADHFVTLLRERFGRLALPALVHTIALAASDLVPLDGENRVLFDGTLARSADWGLPGQGGSRPPSNPPIFENELSLVRLVERLRARLGASAVHGLAVVAEHRPEYAVQNVAPGARSPKVAPPAGARPLWLLRAPRPLAERDAQPYDDGPLTLLAGPERIESGWWDERDVARDYFIAARADRSLVWIYRTRNVAGGWFLHGLFG